jgi:hypothetical protein
MRKLYGDSMRKEAGFVKVLRSVASKNARIIERRAGRHGPEIKRVAKEVKGTFDKVYEETAEVVEDFLAKCTLSLSLCLIDDPLLKHHPANIIPYSATQDHGSRPRYQGPPAAISGKARHLVCRFPPCGPLSNRRLG